MAISSVSKASSPQTNWISSLHNDECRILSLFLTLRDNIEMMHASRDLRGKFIRCQSNREYRVSALEYTSVGEFITYLRLAQKLGAKVISLDLPGKIFQSKIRELTEIFRVCPTASTVSLTRYEDRRDPDGTVKTGVPQEIFAALNVHCPNLRALDLLSSDIQADALVNFVKHNPNLEDLNLRCCRVSSLTLYLLKGSVSRIRKFDLSRIDWISAKDFIALISDKPPLTQLFLSWCDWVNSEVVQAIGEHLPNLEFLDIAGSKEISLDAFTLFALGCTNLRGIRLSNCDWVCPAILQILGENTSKLEVLELHGCEYITLDAVISILQKCQNLRTLGLLECFPVDQECLEALKEHLPPRLSVLKVDVAEWITDEVFEAYQKRGITLVQPPARIF